jgi:hypothetical protein
VWRESQRLELDGRRMTRGLFQDRTARMCNNLRPAFGDCIAWESEWTCFGGDPCLPYVGLGAVLQIMYIYLQVYL